MSVGKFISCLSLLKAIIAACLLSAVITSCKVPVFVKKYPVDKPFVYETNINLIGNFSNADRAGLIDALEGQLDDSLRARRLDKLAWKVLKSPPQYDSTNADKSIQFMRALLVSLGYFNDTISYRDSIYPRGSDQLRTIITFDVAPRKQWLLWRLGLFCHGWLVRYLISCEISIYR